MEPGSWHSRWQRAGGGLCCLLPCSCHVCLMLARNEAVLPGRGHKPCLHAAILALKQQAGAVRMLASQAVRSLFLGSSPQLQAPHLPLCPRGRQGRDDAPHHGSAAPLIRRSLGGEALRPASWEPPRCLRRGRAVPGRKCGPQGLWLACCMLLSAAVCCPRMLLAAWRTVPKSTCPCSLAI